MPDIDIDFLDRTKALDLIDYRTAMRFEKGKTASKLTNIGNSKKSGTKVVFKPDREIFQETKYFTN